MWAPVANRVEFLDSGGMSKDGKDLSALEEQFDKAFLRNLGQIWTSGVFLWLATLFWNSVGRIPKPTPRGLGPLLDAWQWTIGPDEQSCWAILLGAAAFVGTLSVAVVAAAWRPSQLEEPVELIVFRWARAMEVAQLSGSSIAVAAAVYGTARTPSLGPVFLLTALVIGLVAAATRSHDGAIGVRLAHVRAQRRYAGCERRLQILRATAPPGALSLRPSRRRWFWAILLAGPLVTGFVSVASWYLILNVIFALTSKNPSFSPEVISDNWTGLGLTLLSSILAGLFSLSVWGCLYARYASNDMTLFAIGLLSGLGFASAGCLIVAGLVYPETWQQKVTWVAFTAPPLLFAGINLSKEPWKVVWRRLQLALERELDSAANQVEATARSVRRLGSMRSRPVRHPRRPTRRSRLLGDDRLRGDN